MELDSPTQTFSKFEPASLDDTPGSWDSLLGDEPPDVKCTELQGTNEDEEDMELNIKRAQNLDEMEPETYVVFCSL